MRGTRRQKSVSSQKERSKTPARKKKDEASSDEEEVKTSSRKPVGSRSNTRQKRSQVQSQNTQVVFHKGTYVAFVDPSEMNQFKIGLVITLDFTFEQLLADLKEEDDEALLDIFKEMAPLVYQKQSARQPVPEYTIITDINVTEEKPAKRGEKAKVRITKQQSNKANKLMDAVGKFQHLQPLIVQKIEQEGSDHDDDEEEEDEDDDDEEADKENEDDEEGSEMKVDDEKAIRGRRIVKGKTDPKILSVKKPQTKAQAAKKKPAKKDAEEWAESILGSRSASKSPTKKRKGGDEEIEEEEEKGEEESMEMIDTSKKQSKKQKKAATMPKVGQKRLRTKKQPVDESEDVSGLDASHEPEEDEGSYDDEGSSQPVKKRKMAGGKEKIVKPKGKKPPKRPTVFKKGRWNPDIELVKEDKYKEASTSEPFLDCCIRCNNKNVIRAAITNNENLLKKCIEEKKKISSLTAYWSPEVKTTGLEIMIKNNQHNMLELLLHPKIKKIPAHSTYEAQRDVEYQQRVHNPQYLKNFIDTGMVSNMAYGARVRKVHMTRGNRQGDNAFLEYIDNYQQNPVYLIQDERFMKRLFYYPQVEYETYKQLYKLNANIENFFNSHAYEAVRAGNYKIAYELIKNMQKHPNFGFNQLHVDVLSKDNQIDKALKQSVLKKANTNRDITPLHCACINPNPKFIKQMLDANPDFLATDSDLMKPVHYAAACEGPEPLQILLQAGATLHDPDNQKRIPLHIAAMTGRAHNIRTILQALPNQISVKDKKGMNAMAYACKFGHVEAVKTLLELGAKVNQGCGLQRMPPLAWAAAYGHYDLCEYLLDNKGRTLGKDKFKRTPLIMAVRNGHTKVASLLLQRGSEWGHCDSSMNTPLHYAAGYGWLDCIDLLLKAGADVNAQNSWKTTPINIAMLKNHQGCVKRLLEEPNVNVNGKDDKGRTLIMLSLLMLDEDTEDFVSFLLRKGADPNIADLEGQTSLHYLAKYQPRQVDHQGRQSRAVYEQQIGYQKKVAQLLIQSGADLAIKDNEKRTPFSICLQQDNAELLDFLKDKVSLNREPELLFAFKPKIFDIRYQRILERIVLNDPPLKDTINCLDDEGLTPFLSFIQTFQLQYPNFVNTMQNKIQALSFLHGNDIEKYNITNADYFDKFAENNPYAYNYNQNFSQELKVQLAAKFVDEILVKPFIKILQFLIDQGANVNAQVGKLKKYRDLEIQKRQMIEAVAEGKEVKIEKEEEKIKRRDEKLEEDRRNKRFAARRAKSPFGQPFNVFGLQQPAQPDNKDIYEERGGEKVLREYGQNGMRNALHMIMKAPQQTMLNFLLSLNINPDEPDYDEITPFNLLSKDANKNDDNFKATFDKLIDLKVRIDFPDIKGRTPFLNYYDQSYFDIAYSLLDMGANVNQMDTSGLFALKYALIRRQNDKIQELLDRGANINQVDNKGRNLLHYAINMSSATADATFETEQFLIERGVDINLKDYLNRTPLHYAFVKIDDWKNDTQIDPIETVSSICGFRGLEIDVADKWQKTPLHYASQRGASICAMYLIQRGADMEKKDIYGNTCLGVGLMHRHYNYGIILIQKLASVHPLVFKEDPERIQKMWDEEEKKQKDLYKVQKKGSKAKDVEMEEDGPMKTVVKKKKHHNLFNSNNQYYDDDYGYGEEDDESDDEYGYQENVFNQQNAFGMNVYAKKAVRKAINPWGAAWPQQQQQAQQSGGDLVHDTDKEGVSMFKIAIRGGQQGLAYLMLDNGYDLMHAMQDAMDEKKFMLVLTLLSKNPNDEVVQQKNKKGQNLFHILSMNASSCSLDHLRRIYDALLKRGVDVRAKDIYGRNALHYAVIGGSTELVMLLLSPDNGYNPNEIDNDGQTPLTHCLKGKNSEVQFYNPLSQVIVQNIFMLLVKNGADVNVVYPEESFKPAFKEDDVEDPTYNSKGKYYTTPLINLIRQNPKSEILRNNLIGLIEHGAKLDVVDSDGRDPIMHAIIINNTMVTKIMLENKKELHYNVEGQDKAGKSAAHYVVNPLGYGSFENVEILKLLHQYGFNLKLKDAQNRTPASYAAEQESGVLLKELARLCGQEQDLSNFRRAVSAIETQRWPESKVDFEADAEQYMDLAHEKEKQQAKEKEFRVPVDKTGKFEKSYSVYYDDNDHPWDVYLTKVDLKNGIYGDYVFYKMQLLYDNNRDLYVVFTRWGRIGENGMNQRTPFNNLDEAKQEYKKIFKQKTGGNDFESLDTFSRVKKKYNLARVNYITVNYKDYLQPFDFDKCPRTKLSQPIYELYEEIANVTMYQKAMNQYGLDTEALPFSAVKKQSIVEARQLLMEIQECLTEDQNISKQGINADYDALTKVKERLCDLSSRYYELIPLARYKDAIAPPLNNQHLIKTQYDLIEGLTNIEYASRMLLAALLRQQEMNPIDYVYQALNLMIEPLENENPEYEVIRKYIDNTRNANVGGWGAQNNDQYEIANIFKIQRKGEAELIQAYKDVPNHFLLFHGSAMFNYIGILSQGLRIAPPEAPPTGYMFGKGVYFADMFDKSFAYAARGYVAQDSYLMLMCEVALGKSKELYQAEYIEQLDHPFLSVKGLGRSGPGYKHTVTCPNGVKIPLGKVINYHENDPKRQQLLQLQHNEYIVYNTSQIRMRYLVQVKKKDLKKQK